MENMAPLKHEIVITQVSDKSVDSAIYGKSYNYITLSSIKHTVQLVL